MKRLLITFCIPLLFGGYAMAQENSKMNPPYLRQIAIHNALNSATLRSTSRCTNKNVLLTTKEGKLLKHNGKLLTTQKPNCLFEIFGIEIKSVHPDSIEKNLNIVELCIKYSIKTYSELPDTMSFKLIMPTSEVVSDTNTKKVSYEMKLIISESPISGTIFQEIKLKEFIDGQYIIHFEYKNGEMHEFDFELSKL